MRLTQHVLCAIDDADAGKFDAALMNACIAIDATSKRLFPSERRVRVRYIKCLRHYYWLLEPMIGVGINFSETRFSNVQLGKNKAPDLAEIIYEVFRCSHAHGEEVPAQFSVVQSEGGFSSQLLFGPGNLHIPDCVVWALLSVVVFSKANRLETTAGAYYLSLGGDRYLIRDWWGREDDFKPIAEGQNRVKVILDGLDRFGRPT